MAISAKALPGDLLGELVTPDLPGSHHKHAKEGKEGLVLAGQEESLLCAEKNSSARRVIQGVLHFWEEAVWRFGQFIRGWASVRLFFTCGRVCSQL